MLDSMAAEQKASVFKYTVINYLKYIHVYVYTHSYTCIHMYGSIHIYIHKHIHIYFICWIRWRPSRRLASSSIR